MLLSTLATDFFGLVSAVNFSAKYSRLGIGFSGISDPGTRRGNESGTRSLFWHMLVTTRCVKNYATYAVGFN
jgi:hypothetical protein